MGQGHETINFGSQEVKGRAQQVMMVILNNAMPKQITKIPFGEISRSILIILPKAGRHMVSAHCNTTTWMQNVKGHTWLEKHLEAWQRHHSEPVGWNNNSNNSNNNNRIYIAFLV